MKFKIPLWVPILGVGLLLIVSVVVNSRFMKEEPPAKAINQAEQVAKEKSVPKGMAMVGGIIRPETDVVTKKGMKKKKNIPKKRHGYSPALEPSLNEQVAEVAKQLKTREKPERYSSFVIPRDFDQNAFEANPEKAAKEYAKHIAPGRVFATAQPSENVRPIRGTGKRFHRVLQKETVRLSVDAIPFAPVTFTSMDLGQFDNSLSSITTVADKDGKAFANYTPTGGTIDEVKILAGSPVTSGQASFMVSVSVQ